MKMKQFTVVMGRETFCYVLSAAVFSYRVFCPTL